MLKSKNVVMRAVEKSDLATIAQWRSNPEVYGFFFEFLPISIYQQERWYEQQAANRDEINFAVVDNEKNLIGTASIYKIDRRNRHAEWGRVIIGDPKKRGKGIGKEIVNLLLEYAFDELNLNKLYCSALAQNSRAIKAYKQMGFKQDGLLRGHVYKGGSYIDVALFSILEATYRKKSKNL